MDNVTISDQFEHPYGELLNYDTYDLTTRLAILDQKHVDIRSFNNGAGLVDWRMLDFDQSTMETLNEFEMGQLELGRPHINGEGWTVGTATAQTDRNHWSGLTMTCPPNITTTTESIIPLTNVSDTLETVDISKFEDTDYFSVALPDFPLASIDLTQSWIDLTSHPAGDFASGPTVSLRLDASIIPLIAGNSEYRRLRSALTGIDLQAITGVRIRIKATTSCQFRAMAMRLLSVDWSYTQLDLDTRLQIMKPTVAPNGSLTRPYDFEFPTLFRVGEPAGTYDPRPIDTSVALVFNTGSKTAMNSFRMLFREGPGDYTQQIDLNGKTMAELNGNIQPDISTISWRSRTQIEIDRFLQSDLAGDRQIDIGRTVDPEIASYTTAFLQWNDATAKIIASDSENNAYEFSEIGGLEGNRNHAFIVDLVGHTMRMRLYPLDLSGNILVNSIIFDSLKIDDEFIFRRRPGRFGWTAVLADGDAYIENISVRMQTYAELQTAQYGSLTPVTGAEIHVAGSEQLEFFEELFPADFLSTPVTITRDRDRATTSQSYRIENAGTIAPQGIQTNLADFYGFEEMEISFDLYYPSSALEAGVNLEAFLSNDYGRIIPISLGKILPDRWQHFKLAPGGVTAQTGRYRFYLIQNTVGIPSTWWIDNIHIRERTLSFYARSVASDPWGDADADWVPFKNHINQEGTGVQFIERGRNLQILGRGHRQSSYISNIKVIPKYAQLGNFVWEEDELYNPQGPTSFFTATPYGLTLVFNGTGSTDPDGDIINYRWNFGDGQVGLGPIVSHKYRIPGTYTPSLIVTDSNGSQATSDMTTFVTA